MATKAIANESALLEIPSALHMSVKQLRVHSRLGKSRLPFSVCVSPLSCSCPSDEMRHSGPTLTYALATYVLTSTLLGRSCLHISR